MSTEQSPKHKPPVEIQPKAPKREETDLEVRLKSAWQSVKSGSWGFYIPLVVIAAVVGGYFVWQWYASTEAETGSALWVRLETTTDPDALKELAEESTIADTLQARIASLERARLLLGPQGIERMGTRDAAQRQDAIENVKSARDLYRSLTERFSDQPVLRMEAFWGAAQAEETLVGVPKEEGSSEHLGSIDRAVADLREIGKIAAKASEKMSEDALARKAADRAERLEKNKQEIEEFYVRLNEHVKGQLFSMPSFPPANP